MPITTALPASVETADAAAKYTFSSRDRAYMRRALDIARRGAGYTSPNPLVGAVLVKNGQIIGEGWHHRYGDKHAEAEAVDAAAAAGESVAGADMYCTLEPCCFTGPEKHQPPCTDLIISNGIARVFIANRDPHPKVSGEGIRILARAGVRVHEGILAEEGESLNEGFFTYQRLCRPFVHLKIAQSLDGRIAAASGDARWITDEKARRRVHRMRAGRDAVLVGSGTILADDPELTVRHCRGRNPCRVVLDSRLSMPDTARILQLPDRERTFVFCGPDADPDRIGDLRKRGIQVCAVSAADPLSTAEGLSLRKVLDQLGIIGIRSVLVEGGSKIFTAFLREGLFDKISIFIAPIILGCGVDAVGGLDVSRVRNALRLRNVRIRRIGDQTLVEGYRDDGEEETRDVYRNS